VQLLLLGCCAVRQPGLGHTGVAREVRGCAPHRAALARGGKRAKIVFKNSRENSYCIISCVCVQ